MRSLLVSLLLLLTTTTTINVCDAAKNVKRVKAGKKYNKNDPVHVVVNKVGPFNNPTETYRYYSLPFCEAHDDILNGGGSVVSQQRRQLAVGTDLSKDEVREGVIKVKQRFGESMVGDRRETSPYDIHFLQNADVRTLCKKKYSREQMEDFHEAIDNNYYFEMFIEDLPMWGYIGDTKYKDIVLGETSSTHMYVFPHLHFHLGYNNSQVVSAKITTDLEMAVDISDKTKSYDIEYTYSVEWTTEDIEWKDRLSKYNGSAMFLPGSFEIHWLSVINSFVLVLLLTAFLTIIMLRILKNDFSRYMELDEETIEEEESGWKLIHGDVFRFPPGQIIFCSFVGVGNQLLVVTFCHLSLALLGWISTTRRGSLLAGAVVLYCLTSFVSGWSAVELYRKMGNKDWARCVILTALIFPAPVSIVFMWVNTVALAHGSTSALPFTALFTVIALFLLISVPLTLVGGSLAKTYGSDDFKAPTRTTKVAREIPSEMPLYRSRPFQVLVAGFLPFSAIYIELHYIFASMWGHHIYTLFGILFVAFVLLIIVTSFITVALLYFQLAREDHRWWWTTYTNGGMIGLFIYAYSFYFYFRRSGMSGILQGSFFFGYMLIISYGFFIMLGAAAFQFSLLFVKYIYSRIKSD